MSSIRNEADVEWTEEQSPDGSARRSRKQLSAATGGRAIGTSLYRVPPGVRPWPRHYHLANEESIYVLAGSGAIMIGDEKLELRRGDYVALPAGSAHVHQVLNESDQDLEFLCMSTMVEPDICIYPDSAKLGVFAGAAPGGDPESSTLRTFVSVNPDLPYWEGEL